MDGNVTVVYRYDQGKDTDQTVRLSTDQIDLCVGNKLIIKRDPILSASTQRTRFFQDSNYDLLEFVDIFSYGSIPTDIGFYERQADGIILRAAKAGKTQIKVMPRFNDGQGSAILQVNIK